MNRRAYGQAKAIGALICIGGALVFTFWKGEYIFHGFTKSPLIKIHAAGLKHHKDDWIKGSSLILTSHVAWSAWLILQVELYPSDDHH